MIRMDFSRTDKCGIGPINFDVKFARQSGWTEEAIVAAWHVMSAIGHAEYFCSHYGYPVPGCSCIACDVYVTNEDLPDGPYREIRKTWEYIGGKVVFRPLVTK